MASGKRYKFQGSSFKVQTGLSAHKEIVSITQANPAVITVTAHGYVTGDVVKATLIDGMTELNDRVFPVDNALTNSFEAAGINSTAYTAFLSGSPQDGRVAKVTFTEFCELTGYQKQGGTADELDATTICTVDAKETELGLSDPGTMTLDFNFAPLEVVQAALREAEENGDELAFRGALPGTGGIVIMTGTVQQSSFGGSVGALYTGSITVRLSGRVFVFSA